ncbi:hypothetical protein Tco_0871358, partial [Tanacetum coccineum]
VQSCSLQNKEKYHISLVVRKITSTNWLHPWDINLIYHGSRWLVLQKVKDPRVRMIGRKVGHTIGICFEIIGFPPGFKRNNNSMKQGFNANVDVKMNDKQSSASPSSSFTSEQMQKLLSLINDNTFGSIHVNMAGRASFFNGNV